MPQTPSDNVTFSINPANGEVLAAWPLADAVATESRLDAASRAARDWRRTEPAGRAALLHAVAAQLRQQSQQLARMVSMEMGKPITEALAEVEKSAWNCDYVADNGPAWLEDEIVPTQAGDSRVVFEPLGVVLSILPWNFPVWQVFRCVAGALMGGNVSLVKHAPNVQGCAGIIQDVFEQAGAPQGVYQNLHLPVDLVGSLIADRRVAAVTLTGSSAAGAKVAAQAGAACKKSLLELGGSDPFIVLEDADLEAAVAAAARARFVNCGQVCLAAKRFIVAAPVAEEFSERLAAAAAALRRGDPLQADTQLGPLAREDLRTGIARQVDSSVQAGARVITGGRTPGGAGWYYEPTVLAGVTPRMAVATEETFGPVAAVMTAATPEDAILLANDSPYGLSAMLWSRDQERARRFARELDAGSVFINAVTASDPRLPVGGVKLSGYGRELGRHGMLELCNVKTVWTA